MPTEFKIPELGENVKAGDVLRVLVNVGDTLAKDQPVVELETDKATVEVPSTVEGKVTAINVKAGDKVTVGQVVLTVENGAGATASAQEAPPAAQAEQKPPPPPQEASGASTPGPAKADEAGAGGRDATQAQAGEAPTPRQSEKARQADAGSAPASGGSSTFTVPELGENVKAGDVLRVLVKVGDTVAVDQPVLELETDKATVEVPSSIAGHVTAVQVKAGDKVTVGQPIFTVDGGAQARPSVRKEGAKEADEAAATATTPRPAAPPQRGPAEVVDISRGARTAAVAAEAAPKDARRIAPAAPSVRRLARELGIDILEVAGSGPGGRISSNDVMAHAKRVITSKPAAAAPTGAGALIEPPQLPDFSKWGPVDRQPMRAIRRKTAEHLSRAWALIPHVTQVEKADITDLEAIRAQFSKEVEAGGGKLTVTAIALKVVAAALRKFPQVNASVDMAGEAVIYKQYVHIGVAVDTDRGLLVPVIRDVDQKSIVQLSSELTESAERARNKKLTLEEMEGGCFTITNLGGIGGTHFSPIVNWPEVAILGMSRARMEPVFQPTARTPRGGDGGRQDGQFVARLMLPLSLSYDHRIVDGADAMRFLRFVAEALEQPFRMVLG
jgi:pyruvate dehydrogenase E2 component (dihydrolipoamide acetyltransferase)